MGEPREMTVYEKYEDPMTDANLFDFRPQARPADSPGPEIIGLEDVDPGDEVVDEDPKEPASPSPASSDSPNPGPSEQPASITTQTSSSLAGTSQP